jgi:hypothetical protein
MATLRRSFLTFAVLSLCSSAFAGFPSTETILPAVGRVPGQGGAQFYTTVWATNLTGASVSFTFNFLKQGQANPNPAKFTDTLGAGETKVYENVVESKLGLANAIGAARITSTGEILVAERIFNQAPGADLGDTEGLFFAGVPKSFSISAGQSASIQGINQGGAENFRYNFALVETGGGSPTVNVQVFDGAGTLLGQKAYPLQPYEQLQPGVGEIVAGIHTTNARITATVTGGTGSVLLAGAQLANVSQDSSGFEMSFREQLLAGSSAAGGLTAVAHDATLKGDGTAGAPLGIAAGQVVRSLNGFHDAVTLAAGANVTITPAGSTLTIASTGSGGGGLTLPFAGSGSSPNALFSITSSGDNSSSAVSGTSDSGAGVLGNSSYYFGVYGKSTGFYGVVGNGGGPGTAGVYGQSAGGSGVVGQGSAGQYGVKGYGPGLAGVRGETANGHGVEGAASNAIGVYGTSDGGGFNAGVFGTDTSNGVGVYGSTSDDLAYAVYGVSNGHGYAGFFDGDVHVHGNLSKSGGSFKIDHPLDPAHEYLSHSFVESPDMKNIYDGVARLDAEGRATVALPEWFEALNRDFRYQLTAIGTAQPNLHVSDEIHENAFRIAGGVPGARVSWMVTGIRQDAWANAHRIPVVEIKPEREQGTYLEPALFGEPEEKSVRSLKARQGGHETASKSDEVN